MSRRNPSSIPSLHSVFFRCPGSWGNNLYGSTGVPGSVNIGLETGDMGDALPVIPLGSSAPAGPQLSATALSSGWRHSCAIVDDGSVLGDTGGQVKW